jgi:hypothetical protein
VLTFSSESFVFQFPAESLNIKTHEYMNYYLCKYVMEMEYLLLYLKKNTASAKKSQERYDLRENIKEEIRENLMIFIFHEFGLLLGSDMPGK